MRIWRIQQIRHEAKGTVRIPPELIQKVRKIIPRIMKAFKDAYKPRRTTAENVRKIADLKFINPYDGQSYALSINCFMKPMKTTTMAEVRNAYWWETHQEETEQMSERKRRKTPAIDYHAWNVTLYTRADGPRTEDQILSTIIHELSHTADPKTNMENHRLPRQKGDRKTTEKAEDYYSSPMEIDAFQNEMVHALIRDVQSGRTRTEHVLSWLRDDYSEMPYSPSLPNMQYIYLVWTKIAPQACKLLKQRVYTALQTITTGANQ